MQLVVMLETKIPKHYIVAPSIEEAQVYCKELNGSHSLLFIDDCFRDTDALLYLLSEKNVQIICCDRDFNFERQFHKIEKVNFEPVDITALSDEDAQDILNIIPRELKKEEASTKKFKKDPILPNLNDMLNIVKRVGGLIKEYDASSTYFGSYDIEYTLQDYYECRSRFFAEKIINSIPQGNKVFANVLLDFVRNVPPYKICSYDKFKRAGYDADLACRAFVNVNDGKEYYQFCVQNDESEYAYQQAAIYFSRNGDFKEAFAWIDKARNLSHYNRFSIDSTYAKIYFQANINVDSFECKQALDILSNCCTSDKRKSIHFLSFAECALQYDLKYFSDDPQSSYNYICNAISYVDEGLEESNISLRTNNKWQLIDIKKSLIEAKKKHRH